MARHDGYQELGLIHERCWHVTPAVIQILDQLVPSRRRPDTQTGIARFYVHPDVRVQQSDSGIQLDSLQVNFLAEPPPVVRITAVELSDGFNRLRRGTCIAVTFRQQLTTTLTINA
jgi:uncharacterized heparinase superfamily protein